MRTNSELTDESAPGIAEHHSTRMAFFIAGFGMAAWAPLVPFAKSRLVLDERMLGTLLLCLGLGSIVTMPFAGALAARFGCRRMIAVAGTGIALALPFLAHASTTPILGFLLLLFGASVGTVDVVVNLQAIVVERAARRPMMSGFHGFYSVGGIVGAAGMSGLLSLGVAPANAVLAVTAAILGLLVRFGAGLLPQGSDLGQSSERRPFALPHGIVLLIGALCFISFLAEGSMLDWSAVLLTTLRHVAPARAGWGFAAFAGAMTLGRLNGDRVVHALGGLRTLVVGGLCAATGMAIVALAPSATLTMIGFALVGGGASNIVPVLFSAIGRQRRFPTNAAVAAVTTMGYCGILTGPALIGFVAHAVSLPVAFLCVGAAVLLIVVSAPTVTRE